MNEELAEDQNRDMPKVSFPQFVFMQYQQAKMMLGDIPNPLSGKNEVNLPMARYTIDVLEVMEEKTKGNLTEDESKLLGDILHDLRISFVYKQQEKGTKAKKSGEEKSAEKESPDAGNEGTDDCGDPEGQ